MNRGECRGEEVELLSSSGGQAVRQVEAPLAPAPGSSDGDVGMGAVRMKR